MNYTIVYRAENSYEANFIKGILKVYSIESKLLGDNLSIAVGELPIDAMQVDILVENTNLVKTKKILQDYKNNLTDKKLKDRNCINCNEIIPSSFENCWNCGTQ